MQNKLNSITNFSNNPELIEINKKISSILNDKNDFENIEKKFLDITQNLNLKFESADDQLDFENMLNQEIEEVLLKTNKLFLLTLLNDEYDNMNAIISFHSGAGGTESYDFVQMLVRMINRYSQNNNFKTIILDQVLDDNGIKSLTLKVCGENAYGLFKGLKGIHRLVRISPFDANKRRHTTFASVEVLPEIENDNVVEINNDDLKIDTYRSGGAGGQHVNKTESAIRITHIPTGIVVCCQNERSQIQNKEQALKVLKSKLLAIKNEQHLDKISEISGKNLKIEWGNQIISYVFCPYTLVKDHRTGYETSNVQTVLDGSLQNLVLAYLIKKAKKE